MMRFLIAVLLLALTAALVHVQPPEDLARGRGLLRAVPTTFGGWDGREYSFDDAVEEELKADDTLIRRYEQAGEKVWLCVVYHQNRRYGAHDPRLCYESQGWILESPATAQVDDGSRGGLEVNTFVARRRDERRLVWYWWTTQGLSTADAGEFRSRMALAGALDGRSWGAFIRIEALMEDGNAPAARTRMQDFSHRVALALPGVFARRDTSGVGGR